MSPCVICNTSDMHCTNKPQYMKSWPLKFYGSTRYERPNNNSENMPTCIFCYFHHRFHILLSATTFNVMSCYYRIFLNNHEISLYDHLSGFRFAPLLHSSRIYLHEISQLFIPTSMFFVSILPPTKTRAFLLSWSVFYRFHIPDSIEQISKEIP